MWCILHIIYANITVNDLVRFLKKIQVYKTHTRKYIYIYVQNFIEQFCAEIHVTTFGGHLRLDRRIDR